MKFKTLLRKPTVQEYNNLRRSVEWPTYDEAVVSKALQNTFCSVVIEAENGEAIGMGRIIGDGAIYLHIQDVIVRPDFQGEGIGRLIMEELMRYVQRVGARNTNVGLMCSKGREPFYKSFGFTERPTEKFGAGMIKVL